MIEHAKDRKTALLSAEQKSMDSMDILVGYILLVGVIISVLLIIAGTLWHWINDHNLTFQYSILGRNYFNFLLSDFTALLNGTIRPRALVNLGIAMLMLTPYVRVAASVVYFALVARNLKYTLFTLFVTAVLTYSLFLR
jgi:uncharacterized membrane protein